MPNDISNSPLPAHRRPIADLHACQIREALDLAAATLPQTLGSKVTSTIDAQPGLPQVYADPALLETVILNLALNSREAMPDGGQFNVSAQTVDVSAHQAKAQNGSRSGRYVRVAISDTGCGIAAENLPRIFDPNFTTKPAAKGAGLGLAAVQGIVKQHHGWIETQSAPGKGTTFQIFLPVFENDLTPASSPQRPSKPTATEPAPMKKPSETILVVEDEPDLCDLVTQLLQGRGYKVLPASSGATALEQWARHKDQIQLVLTDMVMPDGMTGRGLAERLHAESPELPIIYTSGHSPGGTREDIGQINPDQFLGKPYRPAQLFEIVQRCLRPAEKAA